MICHEDHTGEDAERAQQESDAHLERQRDEAMVTDNPNPLNARCGLAECDCEYTIGGLLRRLEIIAEQSNFTVTQTRKDHCDPSCLCYVAGSECSGLSLCVDHPETIAECPCYQAGYEAERRPIGA